MYGAEPSTILTRNALSVIEILMIIQIDWKLATYLLILKKRIFSVSKWRKSRKILQPPFSRSTLPRYTTIINEKADFLVNAIKNMNLVDGPEFDACDYLSNLVADILISRGSSCNLSNIF